MHDVKSTVQKMSGAVQGALGANDGVRHPQPCTLLKYVCVEISMLTVARKHTRATFQAH